MYECRGSTLQLICFSTRELERLKKPIDLRILPLEIRRMIFEFLFVEERTILVPKRCHNHSFNIFRTCKQIREETYAIFFGLNRFEVIQSNNRAIWRFLIESTQRQRHLGHIKLHISRDTNISECLRALEGCQGLRSLAMIIKSVPSFRGAHNPDNLCSLKFNKPAKLNTVEVETKQNQEHQNTCPTLVIAEVLEETHEDSTLSYKRQFAHADYSHMRSVGSPNMLIIYSCSL